MMHRFKENFSEIISDELSRLYMNKHEYHMKHTRLGVTGWLIELQILEDKIFGKIQNLRMSNSLE